MNYSFFYI